MSAFSLVSVTAVSNAIAVFAKAPLPGRVKTRLHDCMSAGQAAELHAAFVVDLWERLGGLRDVARCLYCDQSWPPFRDLAGAENYRVQQGAGLGERMLRCMEELLRLGHKRVVVLGSDSPTLPLEFIDQAFRRLDQADAVLGPAEDGGYYAVGCRRTDPRMFSGVTWSSPETRRQTERALEAAGFRVALLPPWYDVDTKTELARLAAEPLLPPRTREWLARHRPLL